LKLKNIKIAMLEKMFPRNGRDVPEIRFSGFTEAWEQCELTELCSIITKQTGFDYSSTIKPSLVKSNSDDVYSFIQNKDFNGTKINFDTDFYIPKVVAENYPNILLDQPSILISISGRIGNAGFYSHRDKAFIGGAVGICKLLDEDNGKFIMNQLFSKSGQDYFLKLVKASSHSNITVEDIRKFPILIPKDNTEKLIIGEHFEKLDKLITLHQRKLEKLKNLKKACLDKMFI
jgi:type I restriction enzyme S subunit